MINVFQPSLGDEELAAVQEVFQTSWVGRGSKVDAFERTFAEHLGVDRKQVTSSNSCTEATFLAMELIGLGPGDEVVLPSVSFVGAANAVAARGARPVFCDVDPRTLNPTVADVEACLTPSTKAVLPLHYGGRPGQIAGIAELCRDRGVWLVEDAANAQASSVDGRACGTFGDIGLWSFDWGKIAVAVDGGILYARDPELAARAVQLAYFGMEQTSGYSEAFKAHTRWWEFEVNSFSRRSIMNDMQAAVGVVQLGRLGDFLRRRARIAELYEEALGTVAGIGTPPPLPAGHESSHYMYWVQLDPAIRDLVARDMFDRGIYTTFRYPLLHQVVAYGSSARLPGAERAAARTLLLPMHQALTDDDVAFVAAALEKSVTSRTAQSSAPARG
ncbi:glutamine--scyllo-inositol aminotransferase [Amycolatopsis antarctica]|uniref:Glutamine--scyllo-inositol aminotransferase n=1 Tax=Amycolatopsis antarctica TaxID=1854586 RepID=A0A263D342_9PSEU|nr:DegT/DnrJ/EryC1/StrS family aminotransferase [Amycolatopsis antarctica]OZM71886.1 glutamine--scyllo-inositol aminotransferase [Amycolatopsis antarctica]